MRLAVFGGILSMKSIIRNMLTQFELASGTSLILGQLLEQVMDCLELILVQKLTERCLGWKEILSPCLFWWPQASRPVVLVVLG